MKLRRRDYEALSIGEYIVEGHTEAEAAKEFRMCASTVRNRIKEVAFLNPDLFLQIQKQILKNHSRKVE